VAVKNEDTKTRILETGKQEFLQKGYINASLREIAKSAGVTTGAIYGLWQDKSALFDELISETAEEFYDMYLKAHIEFRDYPLEEQVERMLTMTNQYVWDMFDFMFDHYEEFFLLFACSNGSRWEHYLDRLAEVEERYTEEFINSAQQINPNVKNVVPLLNHMLSGAYLSGFSEAIVHSLSKDEAKAYLAGLTDFFLAGWKKIMGLTD